MRLHLLFISLLAAALGPAASSASAAHCAPRAGEHTLARSALAVVTLTTTHDAQRLIGCSRGSGARRLLHRFTQWSTGADVARSARLAGTRVIYRWERADRGTTRDELTVDDAVHRGRRQTLTRLSAWPVPDPADERIATYALAPDGTAAWIVRGPLGDDLRLWRAGTAPRRVDHGFALAGPLTFSGGTVRWRHGDAGRSAPMALPGGTCVGFGGTDQLGVRIEYRVPYVSHANGTFIMDQLTTCTRATGATSSDECTCPITSYDVAGSFVAVSLNHRVARDDRSRISAGESWTVEGDALVAIDAAGSMVWADRLPGVPFRTRLWSLDRHGLRELATLDGHVTGLARDDHVVVVNPSRTTIVLDD
jgi:hypothetical protein